jgi:hypothetical protein
VPENNSSGTFFCCTFVISTYTFDMKTYSPQVRYRELQLSTLKQIGKLSPFVEGSLCEFKRAGRKSSSWHLTFKVKNKTRTVYVPVEMVKEVQEWTKSYRRLKQLIRKETKQSLAVIHRHAAGRRAAGRSLESTSA